MNRRYDICWRDHGPTVEPHCCRDCVLGVSGQHGYSWDEACAELAAYHIAQSNEWACKREPMGEDIAA